MSTLAPWANGPFELIVHAEEHLRNGDDFDRRIALISFDDAIEVAVTTYLTLHPIQRGNREYPKAKCELWLKNFHTKLDFIGEELAARALTWKVEKSHIVWAHEHRNEQYHGGKKGTPEQAVLTIARSAAHWIIGMLFDLSDVEQLVLNETKPVVVEMVRNPNKEFDKAIDETFGALELGGTLYGVSELLFNTDYEAYRDLGASLIDADDSASPEKIA